MSRRDRRERSSTDTVGPIVSRGELLRSYAQLLRHGWCNPFGIDDRTCGPPDEDKERWLEQLRAEAAIDGVRIGYSIETVFGTFLFFLGITLGPDGETLGMPPAEYDPHGDWMQGFERAYGEKLVRARERVSQLIAQDPAVAVGT